MLCGVCAGWQPILFGTIIAFTSAGVPVVACGLLLAVGCQLKWRSGVPSSVGVRRVGARREGPLE